MEAWPGFARSGGILAVGFGGPIEAPLHQDEQRFDGFGVARQRGPQNFEVAPLPVALVGEMLRALRTTRGLLGGIRFPSLVCCRGLANALGSFQGRIQRPEGIARLIALDKEVTGGTRPDSARAARPPYPSPCPRVGRSTRGGGGDSRVSCLTPPVSPRRTRPHRL